MPDEDEHGAGDVSDGMSENEYEDNDDNSMTETTIARGIAPDSEVKKKYDPKDPLRPRRKKARRACYACQRAHLTCGDERPCQRCIKRGLADACQDGVRKKAKYLHDAPPEALRPVLGPTYTPTISRTRPANNRATSSAGSDGSTMNINTMFTSTDPNASFSMLGGQNPLGSFSDGLSFPPQQSPVSPFQGPHGSQMPGMAMPQVSADLTGFFDAANLASYTNLDGLGFGSQYGALEFGILNQMTNDSAQTPTRDASISTNGGIFNMVNPFDGTLMGDVFPLDNSGNPLYAQGNLQHGLPHAYAIPAGSNGIQSPSTENDSPQPSSGTMMYNNSPRQTTKLEESPMQVQTPQARKKSSVPKVNPQSLLGKRRRDPSSIYDTVKEPFSYVGGFHRLIATLKRRFPGNKISRIAQALASFRPSFISCTRNLNRADLIFMEKCFQRTLFEYEDFMHHGSSPTIVCRRTGEIAAVNKEFTALTGWTREVLLGEETNLNINSGTHPRSDSDASGVTTPKLKAAVEESRTADKPQPLFIAELMDDDSVVQFYNDFAHLAFGDARGSVTRKCQVLKYRRSAADDTVTNSGGTSTTDTVYNVQQSSAIEDTLSTAAAAARKGPRTSILSARVARIDGEHGIERIGKDGKLTCTYCWVIRRDTFDMPMMIVMNFLPCYYPNQEPHQLAV